MFISEMLFWLVQNLKVSSFLQCLISAVIAVGGMFFASHLSFRLPFALDVGMVGVGLFQIGKLVREKVPKVLNLSFIVSVIGIIAFSKLVFINGYVNLRTGTYGSWPLFWLNAVGMTLCFWNLSRYVWDWLIKVKWLKLPLSWITAMGRDSIVFLCLNQLVILYTREWLEEIIPDGKFDQLTVNRIILALVMAELFALRKLIMDTKLKVVVGKW